MNVCRTCVYKRITEMSSEEINKEIDCVINERKQRDYMVCSPDEYVSKLIKISNNSSIIPFNRTTALKRYNEAQRETEKIINVLEEAKLNKQYSVINEKNGFDTENNNTFLFLCFDEPFRSYKFTKKVFTDKHELIDYLKTLDTDDIEYYDNGIKQHGFSDKLENMINMFYKKHGDNNILIEFG